MKQTLVQLLKTISENHSFSLVDVGSMGGIESEWEELGDQIRVIGFEPDKRQFAKLQSTDRLLYLNNIVSSKSESIRFNVSREPGKSSIFEPNREFLDEFPNADRYDTVDTVEFGADLVDSLDNILEKNEIDDVDFLKIDTQGSELAVLQGSEKCIDDSLLGLKVEVEFVEIYKKQPLFHDVDQFLRGRAFNLIDIRRAFWKRNFFADYNGRGQLIFGDALYFKDIHSFLDSIEGRSPDFIESKIYKFIIVALRYGMLDYAFSILLRAQERSLIARDQALLVRSAISNDRLLSRGKRLVRGFRGAYRAYTILGFLQNVFTHSYTGWADGDEYLGNK
jgi:FkbM family methyltransferase